MSLSKRQQEILELYKKIGTKLGVAKELGIARSTVQKALHAIRAKGYELLPDKFNKHNPTGFDSVKTTRHIVYDEDGTSTVKEEWLRSVPALDSTQLVLDSLKARTPVSPVIPNPKDTAKDLMVEWCLADLHHGMKAAVEETGKAHNVQMSRDLVVSAAADIFSRSGKVGHTRIISLGDFFHSDFFSNKTEKSGHSLWTSDTYVNIIKCGVEAVLTSVDIALQNSNTVELIFLSGNHCHQSSAWLQVLMETKYSKNKRVIVSSDQTLARFSRWGVSWFGYHHGHTTNAVRLAMETLTRAVSQEPGLKYFYARTAHLHNGNKMVMPVEDSNGVIIERIPTITPKDKFTADGCYNSMRGTVANVFHLEKGLRYRLDILPDSLPLK